jgi:hypothetical protein
LSSLKLKNSFDCKNKFDYPQKFRDISLDEAEVSNTQNELKVDIEALG